MANESGAPTGRIVTAGRIVTCDNHPQEFHDDLNFETTSGLLIEMPDDDLRAAAGAMLGRTIEVRLAQPPTGTNLMEATAPVDRPREALSQLRDIAEWLGSEGHHDLGGLADDLADDIARRYPEAK